MELDSESEDEPTGLRDDYPHPVSDSDEDESDGEGLAEFRKALRDAEPRKYRILNPAVNPVPANADEFDVVDDFNQVEAGDAILSTFPGARATREDGGQTKVLVGPDELHRKFVLFLGEYARIPDPDYEVTVSASKLRVAFDRGVPTPSTQCLLDGVVLWVSHRTTSQHGRVVAVKRVCVENTRDSLADVHTGQGRGPGPF